MTSGAHHPHPDMCLRDAQCLVPWRLLPAISATVLAPLRLSAPAPQSTCALTALFREHEAHEVFVTGSFDDWRKTVQLEKKDGIFQKTVELPKGKHQYKVRFSPDFLVTSAFQAHRGWRSNRD